MKLLYAEDEESMAEAVTDILVFHKYQVDTVYDGEEALEYARKEIIRTLIMLSEGQQSVKQQNEPAGAAGWKHQTIRKNCLKKKKRWCTIML